MIGLREFLLAGTPGPDGRLEWTASHEVVLLAGAAALVAWGLSLVGERAAGISLRVLEAILFGGAVAGVVVALARPVWIEEAGRTEPGRVAVLVDASRSMSVLENGKARSEQADAVLEALQAEDVDVYQFGQDLAVGRPTAYDLPATDLGGALDTLSERVAGEKLAGIVVITDGLDRGLLRHGWRDDPKAAAPQLPGPLTVYQTGTPGDLRDLSVRGVDSGGYAFVRIKLEISVHDRRDAPTSDLESGADRGTFPLIALVVNDTNRVRPGAGVEDLARSVGRSVVDHDQLERLDRQALGEHRPDRFRDGRGLVVDRHQDRQVRAAALRCRRSHALTIPPPATGAPEVGAVSRSGESCGWMTAE